MKLDLNKTKNSSQKSEVRRIEYMKKNIIIRLLPVLIIIGMVLISCEKDQLLSPPPIIVNGCDTINISFSQVINPIIISDCVGCHGSGGAGGVNLDGYDNIKTNALNGELVLSINGTMRQFLKNDCELLKIQAWVNKGASND
jgi:hypothetical protein